VGCSVACHERSRIPIALLHSRVRFIGEFLKFATTARSPAEVLALANQRYGCGWSTQAQVSRRRGWLQSAGMLQMDASDQLVTTELGQELVAREISSKSVDEPLA
jgi:hypothetical protein